MGWKTFQAKNNAPIALDFQLVDYLHMKPGKIDVVGRPQIERSSQKRNSPETVVRFGFCMYHESNECSVIEKTVIFKTFMNIWSTIDCMIKEYRQIDKPTFDLRQALDRLLRSHDGGTNFCSLVTFQRCPVKVRNFWGQLPKNIPVGNVWKINQTNSQIRNGTC